MSESLKHSKLGISSCLIAVGVWVYFAMLFYVVFYVKSFPKFFNDYFFPDSNGIGALGVAIILFAFLFAGIPVIGHFIGFICGIIGSFAKNKQRLFAITGIFLNALPFAIGLILYFIGYFKTVEK